MKTEKYLMTNEEKIGFGLKSLYRDYGYSCFKMSKFEEYDLYGQNKDFLISDSVITFTDTDGKLMALKPDVTLSIVKNSPSDPKGVERLFYNENVYRISDSTRRYKEIMQTGLECIGNLTDYNVFEVVFLAAKSLESISENNVLVLSHLGVLTAVFDDIECDRKKLLKNISEKNIRGVRDCCSEFKIEGINAEILNTVTVSDGEPDKIINALYGKTDNPKIKKALKELNAVVLFLKSAGYNKIRVDFSLVSDMNYYNGVIFRGYVKDVPARVISGGQYDKLMAKMGKKSKAVGFAVYLDLTERVKKENPTDVDVLLIYNESDDPCKVLSTVNSFVRNGESVAAYSYIPEKLIYGKKVFLNEAE